MKANRINVASSVVSEVYFTSARGTINVFWNGGFIFIRRNIARFPNPRFFHKKIAFRGYDMFLA